MTPPQKTAKCQPDDVESRGGLSEEQVSQSQASKSELAKKSVAQLGAMLARNGLPKAGKKDELVERVAECRLLGVPPICSVCSIGRLRWSRESNAYACPGHFDEVAKRMRRCKGPAKGTDIRRLAWQGGDDACLPPATLPDRGMAESTIVGDSTPFETTQATEIEAPPSSHSEAADITEIVIPKIGAVCEDPAITHIVMQDAEAHGATQAAIIREPPPPQQTQETKDLNCGAVGVGVLTRRQPRPIRRSKYFV
jgi:hypothetical protein